VSHEGGVVLDVDRLSVSLGGREILRSVDFALRPGEFCGLIGANGSGKTTLLRSILGFQAPTAGQVKIARTTGRSGLAAIGYVPQKTLLDPYFPLRARDVVTLGLTGHRLGIPLPSAANRRLVDEMLAAVDAAGFADRRIGNLSGGQQQRVLIAHALVRRPRLLLLDEPLANLDIGSAAEIVGLLRRLAREQGVAVLLSAHDMNPLMPAMDRIVYLAHGRAVSGVPDEVIRTEVLSGLYGYHIDVIRVHGRVLVIAAGSEGEAPPAPAPHVALVP
jgi:zinc/manganese transport system ATP-binding protein